MVKKQNELFGQANMWIRKVDECLPRADEMGGIEWGVTANLYGVSFLVHENGLKLGCGVAAQL